MLDYLEQGRMAAIRSISLGPIASNEMSFGGGHTTLNPPLDDIITIAKTLLPLINFNVPCYVTINLIAQQLRRPKIKNSLQ